MYGVFWITPPQSPASTVASASVSSTSRVRYSSPAASALSVLSIPPMIVTSANGSAIDRYGSVSRSASSHASVGHGIASPTSPTAIAGGGPAAERGAPPEDRRAGQHGREGAGHAERHPHAAEQRQQQHDEGDQTHQRVAQDLEHRQEGDEQDRHAGDRAEQRGPRHHPPGPVARERRAPPSSRPMAIVTAMPTFHASTGSPVASFTGPSTPKTIANSVGVSMPNGIAVTSLAPGAAHEPHRHERVGEVARRARRARCPGASGRARDRPGTRRRRSAGSTRMTRLVVLSRARPRKPLTSPAANQRGGRALSDAGVARAPGGQEASAPARGSARPAPRTTPAFRGCPRRRGTRARSARRGARRTARARGSRGPRARRPPRGRSPCADRRAWRATVRKFRSQRATSS